MALATWKDLCIDVADLEIATAFWAHALCLKPDGTSGLRGPTPQHTVWLNEVPEPKTVKNRVHLDVHTDDVRDLTAAGACVLDPDSFRWTLLADPEGGEFCAFLRDAVPEYRLYELGVDCADALAVGQWWADAFGVPLGGEPGRDWCWIENIPLAPFDNISFVPVPEPKTAKNRVHWDVIGDSQALQDAGARLLLPRGDDRRWDVLADPEGNEFCVFPPAPA